jgi:hypothetical protein
MNEAMLAQPNPAPTTSYLRWLLAVRADVRAAIVEAIDLMHLSVRVSAGQVDAVRELLAAEWYAEWKIDVTPLGYAEPFVYDVHIFA